MKTLVTGAAGFIGSKISYLLAERGDDVVGIDNINDYYDVRLKYGRLRELGIGEGYVCLEWNKEYNSTKFRNLKFLRIGIDNHEALSNLFATEKFDKVINLAAQAGVRYSIANPYAYMTSNLQGFLNVIECCRNYPVKHLLFASSSSVYGLNEDVPFKETDSVGTPVSLYAASKRANELMAHAYCKLYGLKATGLRYFTVYGPWGRPDMAPIKFTKLITDNQQIDVYNDGNLSRDFTYIDDIVNGTIGVIDHEPNIDKCLHNVPFTIYNIGCSNPVKLMDFINEIELAVGKEAKKNYMPMQPGDVYHTYASTEKLEKEIGYKPSISLHEGIGKLVEWYKSDKNPLK